MKKGQNIQKTIFWTVIVSETSHVFCCVLPTLFSLLGMLSGLGFAVGSPFIAKMHDALHAYELPVIAFSFTMLLIGWGLLMYSRRIDCHDTGCTHGSCKPGKDRAGLILKIATVLFVINLFVYVGIHRNPAFNNAHDVESGAVVTHEHSYHTHGHDGLHGREHTYTHTHAGGAVLHDHGNLK